MATSRPHVLADRRELRSGIPAALRARGADVETRSLFAADYVLSDRLAVQRRSAGDLDAAIVDGRLFRHLAALTATYPAVTLLVVGRSESLLSEASRRGALAWVARQGVALIRARDAEDAAGWLLTLAAQEGRLPRNVLLPPGGRKPVDPDEQLEALVATLPGIGPVCARRLLQRFGSLAALVAASEQELRAVRGIGPTRARTLAALFGHAYRGVVPEAAPTLWAAAS
jgi:Fanconi anemia group M protein